MMGLILQIVFAAVSAAGEFISLSMGLGFAMMVDPNSGVQTPVISQFMVILATLVFVSIGGHLILIELLLDSFRLWPIGEPQLEMAMVWDVLQWSILLFTGAGLIALPAMIILLLTNSAMGVISRAAPSLNVFAVGFPLTLLMGIVVLIVLLPTFMGNIQNLWFEAFQQIRTLLGVAKPCLKIAPKKKLNNPRPRNLRNPVKMARCRVQKSCRWPLSWCLEQLFY
jgi:flagellar biosynthetic protein FliR